MKYSEAVVFWDDDGNVDVRPLGEDNPEMPFSGGAAYTAVQTMKGDTLVARMMADAWYLILKQGLDIKVVHDAFLKVDEYRRIFT